MFTEGPAQRPEPGEGTFRYVLYPGRGRIVRGHILCPRPRQFRVHFSPLLGKTLPCLKVMCFGCKGSQPLVERDYLFLPMLVMRPRQEMVVGIQRKHCLPIWDHPDAGDYWRGVTITAGRGPHRYDECSVTVEGRVPDDYELPPEWDVSVDLTRVWSEHIPRQWDGRLTELVFDTSRPGQEG